MMFATVDKLSATEFRQQIHEIESAGGWPVLLIGNHDMPRSYNRYGDGVHDEAIAKLMAVLYLTLRGTPILYYGEEIAMENNDPKTKEDVRDPQGKIGWPTEKGRDGERTPMQWTAGENAGFSRVKPWLPVPASAHSRNVESELRDPDSVLNFYRRLLALRHAEPALLDGDYVALDEASPTTLSFLRRYKNEAVVVLLNMSAAPQTVDLELSKHGFGNARVTTLLSGGGIDTKILGNKASIEPFTAYVAKLQK